jgi:hypothetical protein
LACDAKSWSIAEVRRGENFVRELNEDIIPRLRRFEQIEEMENR